MTPCGLLLLAALVQSPDSVPADTYADAGVERLLERARAARGREAEGILSYEGRLLERVYVGLAGRRFRRERGLFQGERAARIRWERDGERAVQWLGARRRVPVLGDRPDVVRGLREDLADDLIGSAAPAALAFDPWDDRIVFGSGAALHPLADSAVHRYRYHAGDTLTLTLPDGRRVTLLEVRVEPRDRHFQLVAGSLWFDSESTALVRAGYRPARPFDLELDEPDDAADVPGILKPITAEISYVTVEYSLHELRWWLPRRFALQGEASIARFARIPITVEWTVTDYEVNEAVSRIPLEGPLPPGWTRAERRIQRDGRPRYVTVLVPPPDSLFQSADLPEVLPGPEPLAFSEEEIEQLRRDLGRLVPSATPLDARFAWGLREGLTRYNRVEGLSTGVAAELPLRGPFSARASARMGASDLEPNGELAFRRGDESRHVELALYRRLVSASDFDHPLTTGTSLTHILFGGDRWPYYRTRGVGARFVADGRTVRGRLDLFAERQDAAAKSTDFHLLGLVTGDTMRENVAARAGSIRGLAGSVLWQAGVDPAALVASGRVGAEVAGGDFAYRRALTGVALARPLFLGLAGAVEAAAGASWGDVPVQRHFFLGGARTLRGFPPASISGSAFWLARAEVANEMPAVRITVFGDAAWAGARAAFPGNPSGVSAGVGVSLLDGVLRADLARAVRGGDRFRAHLYLDALF